MFRICMGEITPGPADFFEVRSRLYSSLKASSHSDSMELVKTLQTSEPRITKGSHDTLYCLPGTLAVIVHKDQTLGPFVTTGPWSQTDVTHATTDYLRSVASHRAAGLQTRSGPCKKPQGAIETREMGETIAACMLATQCVGGPHQ